MEKVQYKRETKKEEMTTSASSKHEITNKNKKKSATATLAEHLRG